MHGVCLTHLGCSAASRGVQGRPSPKLGRGICDESRGFSPGETGARGSLRLPRPRDPRIFGFPEDSARRRNALRNSSLASNPSDRDLCWVRTSTDRFSSPLTRRGSSAPSCSGRCGVTRAVRTHRQRALEVGLRRSRLLQPIRRGGSARKKSSRERASRIHQLGWLMRRARRRYSYRSWREPTDRKSVV